MELVFLGTGSGFPSRERNVAACVLNLTKERNSLWLFDCGEGTQHQFLRAGLKLNKIEKIFISHLHGDHLFGLPGLLSTRSFKGGAEPVTIYGPRPLLTFLRAALEVSGTYLPYPLNVEEIQEGVIFEDDQFTVTARPLSHRLESFGFRVAEKEKPGSLDADRLKAAGIPPGPLFQKLKQGEAVTLGDGRIINGRDFLRPGSPGKVAAILGDTMPCAAEVRLAEEADVVVREATYEAALAGRAREHGHSTTVQAALLARAARAKKLIITHISSRYEAGDTGRLLGECREIFPETEMAADLDVFPI